MHIWVSAQSVTNNNKQKIRDGDNQSHRKTNRSLAAMRGHTERHTNNCKCDAGERKRKPFVYFRSARAALPFVFAFYLVEQLLHRQCGTARSCLFFFI